MRGKRYTLNQIVRTSKEAGFRAGIASVILAHGVNLQTAQAIGIDALKERLRGKCFRVPA